ncbi:MAG: hypothetical protein AB1531_05845 [Chloroflexota bacterium]
MRQIPSVPHNADARKQVLDKRIKKALIGQFTCTFMGVIALIAEDTQWPWWPLGLGLILTVFSLTFFVYIGVVSRRAYLLYITYFVISILWLLPLTYAVAALMSNTLLIFLMLISCCAVIFVKYISALRGLGYSIKTSQKSGLLNITQGLWDISKSIPTNANRSSSQKKWTTIALFFAPFGAILGTLLYHYFSEVSRLVGSLIYLILIFAVSPTSGSELAIGTFLKRLEGKIGKPVFVK